MINTLKNLFATVCLFPLLTVGVKAQQPFYQPEAGFTSVQPAASWEHSLLSGNGTMGVMVPGEPYDERLYVSHAALYLPFDSSGKSYTQAKWMGEIRQLCLDGKYEDAGKMIDRIKEESISGDERDAFISGLSIRIRQERGVAVGYQRAVDYQTGEAFTEWKDENGTFRRSVFVSRPDSIVVVRFTGDAPIHAVVTFDEVPVNDYGDQIKKDRYVKETRIGLTREHLVYRTLFRHTNVYNSLKGYEGAGRVIHKGGCLRYAGNEIIAEGVDELLILACILPLSGSDVSQHDRLIGYLDCLPSEYEQLLRPHEVVQKDLYGRVSIDLGVPDEERKLCSEQLIARSQTDLPPLAMIEKAFNAGRYNIISCTGYNPPNLQGLWSGTWSAPWFGSFTTNGNQPTAMSFFLPGNTPVLMQSYFDQIARMIDRFRISAREVFGTRGFHVPAQMTTNWRVLDNYPRCPHSYWTAGTAWAARWYFDYYQYTGDVNFLRRTGYPMMKEAALFFEDFLCVERDGKFIFVPSFSPENKPASTQVEPSINSTMDIAACRQLLRNCITAARTLGVDKDKVKVWKNMLEKMPEYKISPEGALCEWVWPGLTDNYMHRHASHLYGLYDELPVEFKENPALLAAAEKAIDYRIRFFDVGGGGMAFGLCNAGWAAAHIGCARQTAVIVDYLAKNYWTTGMGSFHNVQDIFNMDISGGFPYLISQCLVYSELGYLKLLPALPERWKKGSISGLLLRGNVILQQLSWENGKVSASLLSPVDTSIQVVYGSRTKNIFLAKNKVKQIDFL